MCCDESSNFDPETGSGNRQTFRYVAAGGEVSPLTITLPAARLNANYNVTLTMARTAAGATAFKEVWPLVNTFTTTDFDVEPAVALELGDILLFTVEDLT
jgi:hypothetical protein